VLLAASRNRTVSTDLPVSLLLKTVPIYSRAVFKEQFPDVGKSTKWKGWSYSRSGVYWCARAHDKGARGAPVWAVDIDEWKGRGRAGEGWDVPAPQAVVSEDESSGSEAEVGESSDEDGSEGEDEDEEEDDKDEGVDEDEDAPAKKLKAKGKKRARKSTRAAATPRKRAKKDVATPRRRRAPHAKASASRLPATVPIETLPADPYERALRLLHVGATPESLPCREEEFIDVLARVEEGIESGGGGCLCEL
jgi:origin recognition complex subunit 1